MRNGNKQEEESGADKEAGGMWGLQGSLTCVKHLALKYRNIKFLKWGSHFYIYVLTVKRIFHVCV